MYVEADMPRLNKAPRQPDDAGAIRPAQEGRRLCDFACFHCLPSSYTSALGRVEGFLVPLRVDEIRRLGSAASEGDLTVQGCERSGVSSWRRATVVGTGL